MHIENEYTEQQRKDGREALLKALHDHLTFSPSPTPETILTALETVGLDPVTVSPNRSDPYDRPGLPPISSYPEFLRELERFKRSITEQDGRRFYACRLSGDLTSVVEALPIAEARRIELSNLVKLALRMILIENDCHISPSRLNAF